MHNKVEALQNRLEPISAQHLADTLQKIGSALCDKKDYPMALKWLRRANKIINAQELEKLSMQALELRDVIRHDIIKLLVCIGTPDTLREADGMITNAESEMGDQILVWFWKLEILRKSPGEVFDTDACASILRRMIRAETSTEAVLKYLLLNIKVLRDRNSALAKGLLDELLLTRLLPLGNSEWIKKVVICRVWMATMEDSAATSANDMMAFLGRIPPEGVGLLDADSTAAAQSVRQSNLKGFGR